MYVESFRKLDLYEKSHDLCFAVYRFVEEQAVQLNGEELLKVRRLATYVPAKIAKAIGQTNMKFRFKYLNEAKDALQTMKQVITQLLKKPGIKHEDVHEMDFYHDQVIKLMNAYFGWMSKSA